ncbi:deoxyribose-phosphate aldolase [Luteipulveratus sp. YIM 133132]|uniref:Cgl0159 family (beta/alpha)8-fold protein n=1 Tax=Luteipulveratus flavus TaxID=3031728 RepID=UPI0023B127C8|nr:deoxyribose-phosphate aldolase [Luteipulveratus sp. YIM 133132]MDE9367061.1 deoxyribose-phosphate aldolase [Luteipulveratus sp. YIM 133132]
MSPDVLAVNEIRARHPECIEERWLTRRRRPLLGEDGRLLLVAADHPARNALGVRDRPMAMSSRSELLDRLLAALAVPGVDGVLGSPDVLDDLLLLGALEDKVAIGSMNRGGLQGAVFEPDDRFTAYDVETIERLGLDGGKALLRVSLDHPGTAATLEATGRAVSRLAGIRRPMMIEPFLARVEDGRLENQLDPDSVVRSIGVASGLGAPSAYTWLKLPVVAEMERVMDATTLPTLLLGGDPHGAPDDTYASWAKALRLPSVRGLVVGRALLYPPDDDVEAAVRTAVGLVRGDAS